MIRPHKLRAITPAIRHFSTAPAVEAPAEPEPKISNAFKNQHIVYIPKKKVTFDVATPDGRMAKVFESSSTLFTRANNWKPALGVTLPAAIFAQYSLAASQLMFVYPMLGLLPAYYMYDSFRMQVLFKNEVNKMWLFQNGH